MSSRNCVAAIYVRISRDASGDGAGVERQEADCRALAAAKRLELHPRVFSDNDIGASAKSKKARPAFKALLDEVRAGRVDTILAYSNSRITRRPLEWEELITLSETHGLQVHTVVSSSVRFDTADGKMILRVLAANDAAEADRISERVTRAKLQKAKEGAYRGGPRPFGYESDGMTVREDEAALVREAADRLLAGESLRSVSNDFDRRGVSGTRTPGTRFTSNQLRAILVRPRVAGLIQYRGQISGKAQWPALLPEDTWHALRALLTDPARRTNAGVSSRVKYLGSSLFVCGVCGDVLRCSKAGSGYTVYRCSTGAHVARRQEPIDEIVRAVIVGRLADMKLPEPKTESDKGAAALRSEIVALRARRSQLADDYADGLLDGAQVKAAGVRIDGKIEAAEKALAELTAGDVLQGVMGAPDAGQAFLDAPIGAQRAVLDALVTVVVNKAGRKGRPKGWTGGTYMDPSTIEFKWRTDDDA